MPLPLATTDSVGEIGHTVEHGVHLWRHVLAVHDYGCISRCTQRGVQNRSLLRDIDFLSAKHRVDSFPQARFLGELQQQVEGFGRDAILRIIEKKT